MSRITLSSIYLIMIFVISFQNVCHGKPSYIESINDSQRPSLDDTTSTTLQQLPAASTSVISSRDRSDTTRSTSPRQFLWTIPFLVGIGSYRSFGFTSRRFHRLVQWASKNTWIPPKRSRHDRGHGNNTLLMTKRC